MDDEKVYEVHLQVVMRVNAASDDDAEYEAETEFEMLPSAWQTTCTGVCELDD